MRADQRRDASGIVEEREEVGVRKQPAERFDNFLASAHAEQPVMNDCDSHARSTPRRSLASDRLTILMSLFTGRSISGRVLFQMAIVGFCTGLVKIAGATKVVFSARAFGVGDAADAYFIAFLVVAFFGDTLAGSLLPALVPTFIATRETDGRASAERLYQSAMTCAVALLSAVGIVLFIAAPWALRPFASHFDAEKLSLTSSLFRWMLPMMPLAAMGSAWRSVLNTEQRFALPAMIPAATPLTTIVFLQLFAARW